MGLVEKQAKKAGKFEREHFGSKIDLPLYFGLLPIALAAFCICFCVSVQITSNCNVIELNCFSFYGNAFQVNLFSVE